MKQPHDEAYHAILEAKYSRIISEISEMHDVSIEQAMDVFYTSAMEHKVGRDGQVEQPKVVKVLITDKP